MLDYKQLKEYSTQSQKAIVAYLNDGDKVSAKLRRDLLVEQFLDHLTHDRACYMSCPKYILEIAQQIHDIPYIETTVAP